MKNITHPWTNLDTFEVDPTIQPRPFLSRDAVKRYAQVYRNDPQGMPPVKLGRLPDGRTILIDGFHRVAAARDVGHTRLRAETIATTAEIAPWLAVEANIRNGVPIPRRQKREVFKRFVQAGQNRLPDGSLMSSRAIAAALRVGSHSSMLNWMKQHFPSTYREMIGSGEEEPEEYNVEPFDHLRDQALADVSWAQMQLSAAITKARNHVSDEELAASIRGALGDFENALRRPLVTLEQGLSTIHGRRPEETADF